MPSISVTIMEGLNQTYLLAKNPTGTIISISSTTICLCISIICLVILNTFLKMLQETIKTILNIICIHTIIMSGSSLILLIHFLLSKSQTLEICSILTLTSCTPMITTIESISILSYMRVHIGRKIANNRSVRNCKKRLFCLTIIHYLIEYFILGPLTYVGTKYFDLPTMTSACAGEIKHGLPLFIISHYVRYVIALVIGVIFDFRMIDFLKNRQAMDNQAGRSENKTISIWRSNDDEFDLLVPVSATITSIFTGVIICIIAHIYTLGHLEANDTSRWIVVLVINAIFLSFQIPIIFAMTLRVAKRNSGLFNDKPNEKAQECRRRTRKKKAFDETIKGQRKILKNVKAPTNNVEESNQNNDTTTAMELENTENDFASRSNVIHVQALVHQE